MYDTINSIKDYYKQVYNLAKKYEMEEHSSLFKGHSLDKEIVVDGDLNHFSLKLYFEEYLHKNTNHFETFIEFSTDGIFIDVNIYEDDEDDPYDDNNEIYKLQNLSIKNFKIELRSIRSNMIFDYLDCNEKFSGCELINKLIDLTKE